jgi:hypothetical protein
MFDVGQGWTDERLGTIATLIAGFAAIVATQL